jgi:hypothetical protein
MTVVYFNADSYVLLNILTVGLSEMATSIISRQFSFLLTGWEDFIEVVAMKASRPISFLSSHAVSVWARGREGR